MDLRASVTMCFETRVQNMTPDAASTWLLEMAVLVRTSDPPRTHMYSRPKLLCTSDDFSVRQRHTTEPSCKQGEGKRMPTRRTQPGPSSAGQFLIKEVTPC